VWGEILAEHEGGKTEEILDRQFRCGFAGLAAKDLSCILLAYEPVWAIGTGHTAEPEIAGEVHGFLRRRAAKALADQASALRILYGGSVRPDNIKRSMAQEEIDGALVGARV